MEQIKGGHFLFCEIAPETIFTPEDITKEHKAIAKSVQEFVAGEIISRGDEIEHVNNELSRKLMKKAGDLGLLAADVPEKYNGMELDKVGSLIISEMLGEGAGSFTITELNHTGIGTLPLTFFGTDDQRKKYLPGLSSGDLIGAFGLTEPEAGSDALNPRTTAVMSDDGKHYILNGTKAFITNAGFADLIFAFAKVDGKAFTAFIVEFDSPGLSVDAEEVKMGMKGTSTRSVIFNNVKVPVENVLGEVGKGHVIALNALNMGRFKVGAVSIGNARATFNEAVQYAVQRKQFGQRICAFGMIKEKIADMAIRLFAGESMMYRTAGLMDANIKAAGSSGGDIGLITAETLEEYLIECSIMKVFGTETQGFVADESVQIFGGYGYIYENPAELAYRNSRINRIWEGTNEINRLTITNTLLRRQEKGEIDLVSDPRHLLAAIEKLKPVIVDTPNNLDAQETIIRHAKLITQYIISLASHTFGRDIKTQQEHIGILSDMIIEVYVLESAFLRSKKLFNTKGKRNAETAALMTKLLSAQAIERLYLLSVKVLTALLEGADLQTSLQAIRKITWPPSINSIALKRKTAEISVEKKSYPMK